MITRAYSNNGGGRQLWWIHSTVEVTPDTEPLPTLCVMSGGVTVRLRSTSSAGGIFIFAAIVDHAGVNDCGPVILTYGWLRGIWVPYDEVGAPSEFGGVVYQEPIACSLIGASWISLVALLLATCS